MLRSAGNSFQHLQDTTHSPIPVVRKIGFADLREALAKGFADFQAYRSDVLFVGIVYAVSGSFWRASPST
ncbi:MAG: hypothetical protein WDM81_18350 [Rhizomicrobium sp.]